MFLSLARGELIVRGGLLHVIAPPGEFAEKELLGQVCANPFIRADRNFPNTGPPRDRTWDSKGSYLSPTPGRSVQKSYCARQDGWEPTGDTPSAIAHENPPRSSLPSRQLP